MGWGTGVPSRLLWVELCQRAGLDPLGVVSGHVDLAMKHVLEASTTDPKVRFCFFQDAYCGPRADFILVCATDSWVSRKRATARSVRWRL